MRMDLLNYCKRLGANAGLGFSYVISIELSWVGFKDPAISHKGS